MEMEKITTLKLKEIVVEDPSDSNFLGKLVKLSDGNYDVWVERDNEIPKLPKFVLVLKNGISPEETKTQWQDESIVYIEVGILGFSTRENYEKEQKEKKENESLWNRQRYIPLIESLNSKHSDGDWTFDEKSFYFCTWGDGSGVVSTFKKNGEIVGVKLQKK